MRRAPHRTTAPRRTVGGMTLIDVLVATVLIAIGLIGLVAMQARAVQQAVSAEDSQRAALLASELASAMWSANTVELPAATITDWNTRVADATASGLPNGVGTVTVTAGVARITVTWRPPHASAGSDNRYITDVLIATPAP
jgi:type IV pilus assembly protein PilV